MKGLMGFFTDEVALPTTNILVMEFVDTSAIVVATYNSLSSWNSYLGTSFTDLIYTSTNITLYGNSTVPTVFPSMAAETGIISVVDRGNFSSLDTGGVFKPCPLLTIADFDSVLIVPDSTFDGCTSLTACVLPVCTNLGSDQYDNNVFNGIVGNSITLTVPSALMLNNGAAPDGDILTLQANNTVTIIPL